MIAKVTNCTNEGSCVEVRTCKHDGDGEIYQWTIQFTELIDFIGYQVLPSCTWKSGGHPFRQLFMQFFVVCIGFLYASSSESNRFLGFLQERVLSSFSLKSEGMLISYARHDFTYFILPLHIFSEVNLLWPTCLILAHFGEWAETYG